MRFDMTRKARGAIAVIALMAASAAAGGIVHAAWIDIDVLPGEFGYIVCDVPGSRESLGFQPAWRDTDGGSEWVAWYYECQSDK